MKMNTWTYKEEPATEKQINFIRDIEDTTLHLFDYENATKESASIYISKYIDEYHKKRQLQRELGLDISSWALEHGYF